MRMPATVGPAAALLAGISSEAGSRAAAPHQQDQQGRQRNADDDGAQAAEAIREKEEHSAIAFVALAGLHLRLGLLPAVCGERPPDVIGFLELASGATP